MAKITLNDVVNLQNEGSAVAAINNNSDAIEVAIENSLSRDGTSPNQMTAVLDMNSNKIINLPDATTPQEPVTNSQAVRYDAPQTLTTPQKQQARDNIGAGTGSGGGGGSSPVTTVFTRIGDIVATSGDYTVAQVTGAAPLASPAFTGIPTVPTAGLGNNTTQAASTAFVIANAGAAGAVTSVFTRAGAVVAANGDYTASQITNAPAGGIAAITVQAAITELDTEKANLASPTFTGNPLAPTPAVDDNDTSIATTAYVIGQAGAANPIIDGAATPGTAIKWSRQDHVHPTDTSRAALAGPTFTGVPAAPTAAPGTNTTQLATTAFVTTADNLKANLASPTFTGTPAAPTAAPGTNTTQLATTAFVATALGAGSAPTSFSSTIFNNGTLAVSAAASALTIAVKTLAGTDPSGGDPVTVAFRNATGTTGDYSVLTLSAANSLVISSGSTLGVTSATAFRLWVVGFNDAGTFRLGVINCRSGNSISSLSGDQLSSSTAEGGAGAADSAQVIYTGTAVTTKPMRVLGYIEWNSTGVTAGTWTTTNLIEVQLMGPDVALPGQIVQVASTTVGTLVSGTTQIPFDNTIPQISEGTQMITTTLSPSSGANLLLISHNGYYSLDTTSSYVIACIFRDAVTNALGTGASVIQVGNDINLLSLDTSTLANSSASTTFRVRAGPGSAASIRMNGAPTALFGGSFASVLNVREVMG